MAEKELLEKAKSSIGIYRQVLRWQETFRKGALGNHEAYNQARDGRSEIEEPKWVKLDDALAVVKAHFAELQKLTNDLQKERNNVLQWVEETFGYGENEEALARAVCNAIQVFMNRVVLKRLALLTQEEGDKPE